MMMENALKISVLLSWLVVMVSQEGVAQCGNFGDPIVRIDFGTAAPDLGNADIAPNYTYTNERVAVGFYTIAQRSYRSGDFQWHDIPTRSGDGYMLLVNADDDPGEFYRTTVRGLCENTEFYYSAWIANISPPDLCRGVLPLPVNVRMEIRDTLGNVLQSISTGEVPTTATTPEWHQIEMYFNTGNNTDIVLVLFNNGAGGCGNNLVIDDIEFSPCGPPIDVMPSLEKVGTEVFQCTLGQPLHMAATLLGGYTDPAYIWQYSSDGETWHDIPGATGTEINIAHPEPGTGYRITVASGPANLANEQCRVTSDPLFVRYAGPIDHVPEPVPALQTCPQVPVTLSITNPGVPGPLRYHWEREISPGNWQAVSGAEGVNYLFPAGQPGTYVYRGVITSVCGAQTVSRLFSINVLSPPDIRMKLDAIVCLSSDPIELNQGTPALFSNGLAGIYAGPGVTGNVFYPDRAGPGTHRITYIAPQGVSCPVSAAGVIVVMAPPSIALAPDLMILQGEEVRLLPATDATTFRWVPATGLDDPYAREPVAKPDESIVYTLIAGNEYGCIDSASVRITVLPAPDIPNGFTPNGDGVNDTWEILGVEEYPDLKVLVVNRWGNPVFTSAGYQTPWDGRMNGSPLPPATYYYIISSPMLQRPLKGPVTILR